MKVCGVHLGLLSLVALACWHLTTGHRRLHFGHCAVSINVHEIRECFHKIRKIIQSQDEEDDIRIVEKSSLQNTRPDEQCCLFRHLLSFYVHQVFKRCSTTDHHLRWRISLIANNFLSMKKDLGFCHTHMTCRCGESSRMKYEVIQSNFEKMDPSTAVNKALGEMDIFLDWIDRLE